MGGSIEGFWKVEYQPNANAPTRAPKRCALSLLAPRAITRFMPPGSLTHPPGYPLTRPRCASRRRCCPSRSSWSTSRKSASRTCASATGSTRTSSSQGSSRASASASLALCPRPPCEKRRTIRVVPRAMGGVFVLGQRAEDTRGRGIQGGREWGGASALCFWLKCLVTGSYK